jgi:hypothetical protein
VQGLYATKHVVNIWGSGKVNTFDYQKKLNLDQFSGRLKPYIDGPSLLDEVELERNGELLSIEEDRLLRIFAKQFRGTRCAAWKLGGGLSGARVFRVKVFNAGGGLVHQAVGKLGSIATIQNEQELYTQYITRLPADVTPRLLVTIEYGAKANAAVFYGLADGHEQSFFEFAISQPLLCGATLIEAERGLKPWREAALEGMRPIVDLRRIVISDADLDALCAVYQIPWLASFESRNVQTRWGCIHGDFHGGNILVTSLGRPAIIDYGDIGEGPLSLDAITLEFSLLFHPGSPLLEEEWPTEEAARKWGDLEIYLQGCPCKEYVRACRTWSLRMAAGKREIAAVAYSYLLRQLKYPDTNKARVLALLEGAKQLWDST